MYEKSNVRLLHIACFICVCALLAYPTQCACAVRPSHIPHGCRLFLPPEKCYFVHFKSIICMILANLHVKMYFLRNFVATQSGAYRGRTYAARFKAVCATVTPMRYSVATSARHALRLRVVFFGVSCPSAGCSSADVCFFVRYSKDSSAPQISQKMRQFTLLMRSCVQSIVSPPVFIIDSF